MTSSDAASLGEGRGCFSHGDGGGIGLPHGCGTSGPIESVSSRDVEECLRVLEEVWPADDAQAAGMPRQLGRFSIVSELGRGGFGVVFLAEDPLLERRVALKVPRVEVFSQSQGWRRFLREARTASRLDHPNLVPLLESGTIGPVGYIVSAFVEGPTLEQCLKDARAGAPLLYERRLVATLAGASSTCTIGEFSIGT